MNKHSIAEQDFRLPDHTPRWAPNVDWGRFLERSLDFIMNHHDLVPILTSLHFGLPGLGPRSGSVAERVRNCTNWQRQPWLVTDMIEKHDGSLQAFRAGRAWVPPEQIKNGKSQDLGDPC
jgi:hypothetical protein